MNYARLRTYLEVATNVAVLLVAVMLLSFFAINRFSRSEANRVVGDGLQKGQQVPSVAGIDYRSSPHTLLIAMNTQCSHCTASVPFFNKLAELKGKVPIQIVAAFPNPPDKVQQYVQENQLRVNARNSADLRQLNIPGTPTMMLIDAGGRIEDFWIGELNSDMQKKVISSLTSLS